MSREFPKNPELKITPATVGRIVLVYEFQLDGAPLIVAYATGDGLTINGTLFNTDGTTEPRMSLPHKSIVATGLPYWDWMDYQKGQAAKTEELEKLVNLRNSEKWSDTSQGNE